MKKIIFNRLVIFGCCAAFFTFASVTQSFGQNQGNSIITTLPVKVISDQSVVPAGGSMLVRNQNGVFVTLTTSGLVPGTVATAWIAIFNTPAGCATNPCSPADLANPSAHAGFFNGGGRVIGADGSATFSTYRAIGDISGLQGGTRALILPMSAEIHYVVRTHGTANLSDLTVLNQQLTMLNGGCPPNTCTSIQTSVHQQ